MDISALLAAITHIRGENYVAPQETPPEMSDLETIIAALKGGKGKGKSKGKEDRECYNCGKVGHLARDYYSKPKEDGKGDGKGGGKSKGKGDSKGKSWQVNALATGEGPAEEGIILGCLVRAPEEKLLNSMQTDQPETWEDFEAVEAIVDSGAGECVCGLSTSAVCVLAVTRAEPALEWNTFASTEAAS